MTSRNASWLRGLVFYVFLYAWTITLGILALPGLVLLRSPVYVTHIAQLWIVPLLYALKWLCGVDYRVTGREYLAEGSRIYACKHQSAFETLALMRLLPSPVYVLKRELLHLPFIGWYLRALGVVAIDRSGGRAQALRAMLRQGKEAIAQGRPIVIFPEGTRTRPGDSHTAYQPGVAALYRHLNVPVVPVALNSGNYWGKNTIAKTPGTITIAFLPPIPRGMESEAFLERLKETIEKKCGEIEETP